MLPLVQMEARVTRDPELRFTPAGKAVCSLRTACNSRKKEGDQWVDDKTTFLNVTVWQGAENVAESITRGDLVMVVGRLEMREYEHEGAKRVAYEVVASSVGPSLSFNAAPVQRTPRAAGAAHDPWASPPTPVDPAPSGRPPVAPQSDTPPF